MIRRALRLLDQIVRPRDRTYNLDASTGSWRTLNLSAPPFAFGAPLLIIDEQCTGWDGQYRDKRLAVWPVASLPRGDSALR